MLGKEGGIWIFPPLTTCLHVIRLGGKEEIRARGSFAAADVRGQMLKFISVPENREVLWRHSTNGQSELAD